MTNEEAIADIVDNIKPVVGGISLDMAIKALKQEPCEDCISRRDAIDAFESCIHELGIDDDPYNYGEMVLGVANLPYVTPKEKTGKWIYREELFDDEDKPRMAYGCSICGHSIKSVHEKGNYCSNCGAKMVEPQESKDKENDTDGNS